MIKLVAFDLDGVIYRGGVLLPGVAAALAAALARGIEYRFVTNNSTAHREEVAARLAGLGLPASAAQILTSGAVSAHFLRTRLPVGARLLVVGETGLMRELREAGFEVAHAGDAALSRADTTRPADAPPAPPAAVVVGLDRSFTYAALTAGQHAILRGALFLATNEDATVPQPDGVDPGAGSLVAAVATAAGAAPIVMGKPGLALAEALAVGTGIVAAETLFVGDRLDTDIEMGERAGMVTALVLTGVSTVEDVGALGTRGGARPDHVLATLEELPALLDRLNRP
jgi:4-nitrophenyl phosphatase